MEQIVDTAVPSHCVTIVEVVQLTPQKLVSYTAPAPVVVPSASASGGVLLTRASSVSSLVEQIVAPVPQISEEIVEVMDRVLQEGTQDRFANCGPSAADLRGITYATDQR